MADIKQAAKWMQEGKRVTRSGWVKAHWEAAGSRVFDGGENGENGIAEVYLVDLLADDWEIAKP